LIPYKYSGFFPPRENYIKYLGDNKMGIEISFCSPKDLLIVVEDSNAYKINLNDYNYNVDTNWNSSTIVNYQFRYEVTDLNGFCLPVIYEKNDSIDTSYFIPFC